ncbi:Origin recognition complex subunit 6 [Macrophomina phaseolina MS6]|uniref:Origin recognition complex subunit 6 n=1 Tax=Macrophomina phaseolina (strain MS6) TaxID=1126212 RepID=K2RXY7_MACPH|nr:Origin recognition complex subunit 6 [Macrophomina phaseolina MS6]
MRTKAVKVLTKVEACDGKDEEDLSSAVERLLGDAKDRGWLEMEWLSNVVEGSGLKTNGGAVAEDDVEMEDARTPKRPAVGSANVYTPLKKRRTGENARDEHTSVSQGGLGTMMQDKVDYLSEARRAEFLRWKSSILKQIEQIEREGGLAMDISA